MFFLLEDIMSRPPPYHLQNLILYRTIHKHSFNLIQIHLIHT